MANIGSLVASMGVNTMGLRGDLSKARRMFKSSSARITKSLSTITRTVFSLRGALLGLGVGLVTKSFIDAASTSEKFNITLSALLGSVEEGNALFKDMSEFAAGVPFEFEKIMASAVQLSGVFTGGREEIKKWMPLIADISATWNLPIEKTTEQIVRMYSAGAASADLFRERGITAALGFEAGVATSAKRTREMLIAAWEDTNSKFRGVTAKLATTWTGQLSMMADAWFQFRVKVMDAAPYGALKAAFKVFLDYIAVKKGSLDVFAKDLGEKIVSTAKRVIEGIAKVIDIAVPLVTAISNALISMWNLFASLPPWVQEVGVVAAFALGTKGKILLLSVAFLFNKYEKDLISFIERFKAVNVIVRLLREGIIEPTKESQAALEDAGKGAVEFVESLIKLGKIKEDVFKGGIFGDVLKAGAPIAKFSLIDLIPIGTSTKYQDLAKKAIGLLDIELAKAALVGKDTVLGGMKTLTGFAPTIKDPLADMDDKVIKKRIKAIEMMGFHTTKFHELRMGQIQQQLAMAEMAGVRESEITAFKLAAEQELYIQHLEFLTEHSTQFGEVISANVQLWVANVQSFAQLTGDMITETFEMVSEGIGSAVADAIFESGNLVKALGSILKDVGKMIIQMLVTLAAKKAIIYIMELLGIKTTNAAALSKGLSETFVNTMASMSAAPFPINLTAPAVAASHLAIASGGATSAMALGKGLSVKGAFHEGINYVPKEGTYLLDKGESVLDSDLNTDLRSFLNEKGGEGGAPLHVTLEIDGAVLARGIAVYEEEAKGDKLDFG